MSYQQPSHGQQPYGPGPGYGAPTPPRQRNNLTLILVLAIGLPLLLLGGCATLLISVGNSTDGQERDSLTTQANPTNDDPAAQAQPSDGPAADQPVQSTTPVTSAPPAVEQQGSKPAKVGESITLQGTDPGLKVTVTLIQVFSPATPSSDFLKPKSGFRYVAVQVTLANQGQAVYNGAPGSGAYLIDTEGQQYRDTYGEVREGPGFPGLVTMNAGDNRKGVIVFEIPESARPAKFQFGLNSGFASQTGGWTLG
ncbi:DUF4352 domain-containing protein [Nonomuraea longicatena]|uniref:DUF4352 domain-containing protein n=1 Tax=Nonomuraea longicatena TaxID=83682 RepID=A0ABN1NU28_9ACTN